jgi:hypothetical protein
MATNLDLKTEPMGKDRIRVSWTDVKIKEQNAGTILTLVILAFGGFALAMFFTFNGAPIMLLVWIGAIIAFLWAGGQRRTEPNSIEFGRDVTTHQGRQFPTDEITRIEYGSEAQMTGGVKRKLANGADAPDQTMIRMWLNDSAAHPISVNNWQTQVNHEIRDALARALDEVRKSKAKEERTQKFGDQGDLGMPDY